MMAEAVYILCMLTSFGCTFLLFRAFFRTKSKLLFWTAICFLGLGINNAVLFADEIIFTDLDLSFWRVLPSFLGLLALINALIQEMI